MSESPRSATLKNDWPSSVKGYRLLKAIGKGYFGIVWEAEVSEGRYQGKRVAIKKYDLEKCGHNKIQEIRKNVLLLNLLDHSNILSYKTSFTNNKDLWVVAELMDSGSVDKIIQFNSQNGLKDQALIATILKEALQGVKYLHSNSQIHRDLKAGNILVCSDGSIKIADFGVSAKLKEGKKRNTFIGSPCWMAPEVLAQDTKNGYDYKVDIWSIGITALELAHGKPPNSELNTMKLILKTINEEPPSLNPEDYWDESFKDFVSQCLVKDPKKRKSADELLKSCKSFFSKAKGKDYIKEKLLKGLGPLDSRVDPETLKQAKLEMGASSQSKICSLKFSFQFDENENEEHLPEVIDTSKIQICKAHLPKLESELILRRTFTLPPSFDGEPHSADAIKKAQTPCNKPSRFYQKQKSVKAIHCKGDQTSEFNFLPEEES